MRDLRERVAYLRGLTEGLDFTQDHKQKLIWDGVLNFCDEVAEDLHEFRDSQNDLADYIEAIDEDLGVVEKYFYGQEENDEEQEVIFNHEDHNENCIEITCPRCKEEICFEDEPGDYEVVCPECGDIVWNHSVSEISAHHDHNHDHHREHHHSQHDVL